MRPLLAIVLAIVSTTFTGCDNQQSSSVTPPRAALHTDATGFRAVQRVRDESSGVIVMLGI